jgi:hypothetical protein
VPLQAVAHAVVAGLLRLVAASGVATDADPGRGRGFRARPTAGAIAAHRPSAATSESAAAVRRPSRSTIGVSRYPPPGRPSIGIGPPIAAIGSQRSSMGVSRDRSPRLSRSAIGIATIAALGPSRFITGIGRYRSHRSERWRIDNSRHRSPSPRMTSAAYGSQLWSQAPSQLTHLPNAALSSATT